MIRDQLLRFARWTGAAAPVAVRDVVGLAGVGLTAFGAYEIYRPAGFIVAGVMLVGGALLSAREPGATRGRK